MGYEALGDGAVDGYTSDGDRVLAGFLADRKAEQVAEKAVAKAAAPPPPKVQTQLDEYALPPVAGKHFPASPLDEWALPACAGKRFE